MTQTIKDSTVLVTGATGGIGQALIAALAARGAAKIYAAARDISALPAGDRVVPLRMDVTDDDDVRHAAGIATDVTLLINNAGVNHNTALLRAADLSLASEEMACNYFAPLVFPERVEAGLRPPTQTGGPGCWIAGGCSVNQTRQLGLGRMNIDRAHRPS